MTCPSSLLSDLACMYIAFALEHPRVYEPQSNPVFILPTPQEE